MPPTTQDLGIDRLDVVARLALAEEIWESVAREVEQSPFAEPQRKEPERRLADRIARPDSVMPWDEIKARALARAR
jgi:putative addiction module component (TIGR02574 family)